MAMVGALLDAHAVHPGRTARNYLEALAATHHLPARRVDEVLELTGMTAPSARPRRNVLPRHGAAARDRGRAAWVAEHARAGRAGQRARPRRRHWVRELVRSLAAGGATVLLSSHLMSEMAQTADDVVVLGRGRLVASGAIDDVVAAATRTSVRVRLATGSPAEPLDRGGQRRRRDRRRPRGRARRHGPDQRADRSHRGEHRLGPAELTPQSASLEDAFFELTKDAAEYTTGGTVR